MARREVKRPSVPGADDHALLDRAAGEVAAGMWTTVVRDHDALGLAEAKHREFPFIEGNERAGVRPTAGQRDHWDQFAHGMSVRTAP